MRSYHTPHTRQPARQAGWAGQADWVSSKPVGGVSAGCLAALPAKGKEYPDLGYKRLRDKPPKAQEQQQQPAGAQ
ncbi:hypothetical protein QJQ45_014984 [Haematococcus lacustris]|nr:hypothetical protein QJQ45_014984 [Haematococcus lacustris]